MAHRSVLHMTDGTEVENDLEELQEHFDLNTVVAAYHDGSLLKWLEDRYYDEEAEQVAALDGNDANLPAKLCKILGAEFASPEFDAELQARMAEKKNMLSMMTDDDEMISHYRETAFTQADLGELLDSDEPVIYLCGEKFRIPIRVENKKYIGLLSKPRIQISAKGFSELKAKNISFENVVLPESLYTNEKREMIIDAVKRNLRFNLQYDVGAWVEVTYDAIKGDMINFVDDTLKKTMGLRSICGNRYTLDDVVLGIIVGDESDLHGYVITWDALCFGGAGWGNVVIKYEDIEDFSRSGWDNFKNFIHLKPGSSSVLESEFFNRYENQKECIKMPSTNEWSPYYWDASSNYLLYSSYGKPLKKAISDFLMMVWRITK